MCRDQRVGDLNGDLKGLIDRQRVSC